jgi:hypothetical protein
MTAASSDSVPPKLKFETFTTIRHIAQKDGWCFEVIVEPKGGFRAVTYRNGDAVIANEEMYTGWQEAVHWLEEQAARIAAAAAILETRP